MAKQTLIAKTRALRNIQALHSPIEPADETVAHLTIIVPPFDHSRSKAAAIYEAGDALSPLMEEILVHTLAPESSRKHLEDSLTRKAKLEGRYNVGGVVDMVEGDGDEEV